MRCWLILVFLFVQFGLTAQQSKQEEIDSLNQIIHKSNNDTTIANALHNLSSLYLKTKPDTSLIIAEQATKAAKKIKDDELSFRTYNTKASALYKTGKLDSAIVNFKLARSFAKKALNYDLLCKSYNNIGLIFMIQSKYDSALFYLKQGAKAYNLSDRTTLTISSIYGNMASILFYQGEYDKAIKMGKKKIHLYDSLEKGGVSLARGYTNVGSYYYEKGDVQNALNYYLKAKEVFDAEEEYTTTHATLIANIANVYKGQKDIDKAIEFYKLAIEIYGDISKQSIEYVSALNNLGAIYLGEKNHELALATFKKALDILNQMELRSYGLANTLNLLGQVDEDLGRFTQAKDYYSKALALSEEIDYKKGLANSHHLLGNILILQKNLKDGISHCKKSYALSEESNLIATLRNSCECLYLGYKQLGDSEKALKYYQLFIQNRDSLYNEENTREVTQKAMQYEFDKIQYRDSLKREEEARRQELLQREKDLKKEAELQKQRTYTISGIIGFLLMLGLAFVLFRGYKNKQKAHRIISAQKKEVEIQKEAVESQKSIIEAKNNEIVDSINYAQRIQNTLLPADEFIASVLPKSFVFFKPKDIVSGDFYWVEKVNDYTFFAAVDCTGHGVPGALVSVVGYNGLNRVLKEHKIYEPAAMLDKLNTIVEETFSKSSHTIKDGMDIALCRIDHKNNTLQFSGANNPMYIVRSAEKVNEAIIEKSSRILKSEEHNYQLFEIKGDKQPIGKFEFRLPFINQEIELEKGDSIYIFSDGYADQFGGVKGKKFMYGPFKRLLASMAEISMAQQLNQLRSVYEAWRGDMDQIDDICVIGVQV